MKLDPNKFHLVDARLPKSLAGPSLFYYRAHDGVAVIIGTTTMPMITKEDDESITYWAVFPVSVISETTQLTKEQCGKCIAEACEQLDLIEFSVDERVDMVYEYISTADNIEKGTDIIFSIYLRISYDDFMNNVSKATDIYDVYKAAFRRSKHVDWNNNPKGVIQ